MYSPRILFVCLLTSFAATFPNVAVRAQITPDQTLGAESSVVRSGVEVKGEIADLIEGGTARGENLFHSFLEFNIDTSERVYFSSPENIATILSRVTGSNVSNVNGLLGTVGNSDAALILMNPNGIAFGEGATLDTQGAFTATTAASIQLGEAGLFSAIDPASDRLLSIDPSAFFFDELATASSGIQVEGVQILQSGGGEALSLVGKDVTISSSGIDLPDSQVQIVAVGEAATAEIDENGEIALGEGVNRGSILIENNSFIDVRSPKGGNITLVADDVQFLDNSRLFAGVQSEPDQSPSTVAEEAANFIEIDATEPVRIAGDGTLVESSVARGANGSSEGVFIRAGSIEIEDNARIASVTLSDGSAGDIVLEAIADVVIDSANVTTSVGSASNRQGGNVVLSGENIAIREGSILGTFTNGKGAAGSVDITAADTVEVSGVENDSPIVVSIASEGNTGDSGDITISSNRFKAVGDVLIGTNSLGTGTAGNISLLADQEALFGAERSAAALGSLGSSTRDQASMQGGNINIRSPRVEVLNGFQISTGAFGMTAAGNIRIEASDLLRIDGASSDPNLPVSSTVGSLANRGSMGRAGRIDIVAGTLEVTNGGIISSSTFGDGDAGIVSIDINGTAAFDGFNRREPRAASGVRSVTLGSGQSGTIQLSATHLYVTNGAQLLAASAGRGDAGSVIVNVAETIRLDGVNSGTETNPSSIGSGILREGTGNGGEVKVSATNLEITNGGDIGADVSGQGKAGRVFVDVVETVRIDGVNPITGVSPSNIGSGIQPNAIGQGGNIVVSAANIELSNGGQIDASVFGEGTAGNVTLRASDAIRIDGVNPFIRRSASNVGSGIQSTQLERESRGGTVSIETGSLEVTNGGQINTTTFGRGDAGSITINATGRVSLDGVVHLSQALHLVLYSEQR